MSERPLPPVTQLAMVSLSLIVAGGIYLSAHLPQHVPLGPAVVLLAASAVLLAINVILLSRVRDFDWERFFQVARWSLLVYAIIAGLILSLVVFSVHVPMLVGFTVARYADGAERVAA